MSLIAETANPALEKALEEKLNRRPAAAGQFGALEGLALRLGLLQHSLRPTFHQPQLVLFAADHGLAVDGLMAADSEPSAELVRQVLEARHPLAALAAAQGMALSVVDAGLSNPLGPHEKLLARKIAHGTRHARVGPAMSIEQAHAAIRAGMEIGDTLPGNAVACASLGWGANESAALVIARLADVPAAELLRGGVRDDAAWHAHLGLIGEAVLKRHHDVTDPVEVLAAMGGFDAAMMMGVMLVAASKRHLILVDGLASCAALLVASRIAHAVPDYALFCRSTGHAGLDRALGVFQAGVLLDLGLEAVDGTGTTLSWPLVRSAAALLDGDDDQPSQPAGMPRPEVRSLFNPNDQAIPGVTAPAPLR